MARKRLPLRGRAGPRHPLVGNIGSVLCHDIGAKPVSRVRRLVIGAPVFVGLFGDDDLATRLGGDADGQGGRCGFLHASVNRAARIIILADRLCLNLIGECNLADDIGCRDEGENAALHIGDDDFRVRGDDRLLASRDRDIAQLTESPRKRGERDGTELLLPFDIAETEIVEGEFQTVLGP